MAGSPLPHAGVRLPPPVLFVGGIAAGWLAHRQWPLAITAAGRPAAQTAIGWGLIVLPLALAGWAFLTFRRWKTTVLPHKPATRIVQDGPFAYTRNPMYVSMTVATAGVAALLNTAWILVLLPLVLALLYRLVIRREEAYLASAFPDDYRAYCSRVRRWG